MDRRTDGWTDGRTDGRTNGRMDERMDGWTDGNMEYFSEYKAKNICFAVKTNPLDLKRSQLYLLISLFLHVSRQGRTVLG